MKTKRINRQSFIKLKITAIYILAAVLALTVPVSASNENLEASSEIQYPVVFLGDSLTEGLALYGFFPDAVHKGINSLNTISAKEHISEISMLKPSRLFILLGINDLWDGEMPHENILNNYREIIGKFKEGTPGTHIHIQAVFPVTAYAMENNPAISNEIINTFNARLKTLALETGVEFIDTNSPLKDENGNMFPQYSLDGVHLLYEYYHIWTELLDSYMKDPAGSG